MSDKDINQLHPKHCPNHEANQLEIVWLKKKHEGTCDKIRELNVELRLAIETLRSEAVRRWEKHMVFAEESIRDTREWQKTVEATIHDEKTGCLEKGMARDKEMLEQQIVRDEKLSKKLKERDDKVDKKLNRILGIFIAILVALVINFARGWA